MTTESALRWRAFSLHKEGNKPEDYEDAFAGNPKTGRFAVADGASESSFASLWAKLLVEAFVGSREAKTGISWLNSQRQAWAKKVDGLQLDWYAEEKRDLGAFATFLGLSFKKALEGKDGRWKAMAVGDSCLFQVRQDELIAGFPASRSADFGNRPLLLASRVADGKKDAISLAQLKFGKWMTGDRFFLMTDALAEWFLRRHETQRRPWHSLKRRLAEPKADVAIMNYFQDLRKQNEMKNDDVTLLMIDL